jgi:hypothetical protein
MDTTKSSQAHPRFSIMAGNTNERPGYSAYSYIYMVFIVQVYHTSLYVVPRGSIFLDK